MDPDYSKKVQTSEKWHAKGLAARQFDQPKSTEAPQTPGELPPIKGELLVPEPISVRDLAALLGQEPVYIIADLMKHGVFANVNQPLDFSVVSKVARNYGLLAKRAS